MKWLLAVGGLLLVSAVPAQAQYGSIGGGSIGHVTFPSLVSHPPTQFSTTVASGSEQDFVPTTYVSYEQGLDQGRAALEAKPKSLAEVAEEHSREAKPKAKLAFVQNSNGDAVIARP